MESVFLIPILQTGALLNKNVLPSLHVTAVSPVRLYPVLHFRDTSLPGGRGTVSLFPSSSSSLLVLHRILRIIKDYYDNELSLTTKLVSSVMSTKITYYNASLI